MRAPRTPREGLATLTITVCGDVGVREARGTGPSGLHRAILLALLPALILLCGAHVAPSSEGPARPVAQPSPTASQSTVSQSTASQSTASQSTVEHDADAHRAGDQDDHDHGNAGSDPHPHPGEPSCHVDGTHDQAGQISRLERPDPAAVPVVLRTDSGGDVEPVLEPPPGGTHETAPARRDCGRRHLVLAQISRI